MRAIFGDLSPYIHQSLSQSPNPPGGCPSFRLQAPIRVLRVSVGQNRWLANLSDGEQCIRLSNQEIRITRYQIDVLLYVYVWWQIHKKHTSPSTTKPTYISQALQNDVFVKNGYPNVCDYIIIFMTRADIHVYGYALYAKLWHVALDYKCYPRLQQLHWLLYGPIVWIMHRIWPLPCNNVGAKATISTTRAKRKWIHTT